MAETTRPPETRLALRQVTASYGGRHAAPILKAVDLEVRRGETVGLVGESGSGKSTIGKVITGQLRPASGTMEVDGRDITRLGRADRAWLYRSLQLIPQDPYASLNPRRTIGFSIAEALNPARPSVRRDGARIVQWLEQVRLPADAINKYPHEFSGGQRQRIAIARALAVEPDLIVADEITSALDVSVQAEILALIDRLRQELGLTILFISHNLAVVRQVCDRVAVIWHGEIVEEGPVEQVFSAPAHPYTRRLLASIPGSAGAGAEGPGTEGFEQREQEA